MVKGGYQGKILRINLTTGSIKTEALPGEEVLRKFVGNFGLGLWYLMRECPVGTNPLDPENPMIFLNAPLVGTIVPGGNNCTITTLNADTQFTAGRSHTHGYFGPFLSFNGYDGFILEGASKKWVYLWIDGDNVELRDATKYLGMDTHETEDAIKLDNGLSVMIGSFSGASVGAIGPSGEHLVLGAMIANDKNSSFSHSGVGTIMGSKKVKAVAIKAKRGKVPLANREKFGHIARDWQYRAATSDWGMWRTGNKTPWSTAAKIYSSEEGHPLGLAAKNMQVNTIEGFGAGMREQKYEKLSCWSCPLGCKYNAHVVNGPYKGVVASLCGGGEPIEGAASIVGAGAFDPGGIFYLADLNDRMGLEASSVGCSMSVAFEAWEKGLLTKEDTDGLELKWGDVKTIETLVKRIAHREGKFANMLADGPKAAADRVGLPEAAIHIKGSGMNLHEWRRGWGELLAHIVGGGSSWHATGADIFSCEPDAGYPVKRNPLDPFGNAEAIAKLAPIKFWVDCIGLCLSPCWSMEGFLEVSAAAIANAVGWEDFDKEEALRTGHRSLTLERIFNMQHGLTSDDDIKVSPRIVEEAPADAGPAAGIFVGRYVEGWVRDYYEHLGWDRKFGKPWLKTLKKLGLEEYTDLVWK